jgi:hypothetical protein
MAQLEQIKPSAKRNLDPTQLTGILNYLLLDHKRRKSAYYRTDQSWQNYLGTAFGIQGCLFGYKLMYCNAQKIFYFLRLAKMDGTHRKLIAAIAISDLLIIDDFGLQGLIFFTFTS